MWFLPSRAAWKHLGDPQGLWPPLEPCWPPPSLPGAAPGLANRGGACPGGGLRTDAAAAKPTTSFRTASEAWPHRALQTRHGGHAVPAASPGPRPTAESGGIGASLRGPRPPSCLRVPASLLDNMRSPNRPSCWLPWLPSPRHRLFYLVPEHGLRVGRRHIFALVPWSHWAPARNFPGGPEWPLQPHRIRKLCGLPASPGGDPPRHPTHSDQKAEHVPLARPALGTHQGQ